MRIIPPKYIVLGSLLCLFFLPFGLQAQNNESGQELGYSFETGQVFYSLSRIAITGLPSPDAPEGVRNRQDVIMKFEITSVADDGLALADVTLAHYSSQFFIRGEWVEIGNRSQLPSDDLLMHVQIESDGRIDQLSEPRRDRPKIPQGTLDLPSLPAEAVIPGASWESTDAINQMDVEGQLQRRIVGTLDKIINKEDSEKPAKAVIRYQDHVHGEDLPYKVEDSGLEVVQLRAKLAEMDEKREREMVFNIETGLPDTISSESTQKKIIVATVITNGKEEVAPKKNIYAARSISRAQFVNGKMAIEDLQKRLQEDAFFEMDGAGFKEKPSESKNEEPGNSTNPGPSGP